MHAGKLFTTRSLLGCKIIYNSYFSNSFGLIYMQKHGRKCSFVPYKCVKLVFQRHNRPAAITLTVNHMHKWTRCHRASFELHVKIHCLAQDVPKIDAPSFSLLFKTHRTGLCASIQGMRRWNPPVKPNTVKNVSLSASAFLCKHKYMCYIIPLYVIWTSKTKKESQWQEMNSN